MRKMMFAGAAALAFALATPALAGGAGWSGGMHPLPPVHNTANVGVHNNVGVHFNGSNTSNIGVHFNGSNTLKANLSNHQWQQQKQWQQQNACTDGSCNAKAIAYGGSVTIDNSQSAWSSMASSLPFLFLFLNNNHQQPSCPPGSVVGYNGECYAQAYAPHYPLRSYGAVAPEHHYARKRRPDPASDGTTQIGQR